MVGMCCYRPDGTRARLAIHVQPGSYNDRVLTGVLGHTCTASWAARR